MSLKKGTVRVKEIENINAQDVSDIKTTLALENVDNTSDANKPISTDTQNALNLKADDSSISSVGKTGDHSDLNLDDGTNPHNTNQSDVGLGNVDNTSDLNKPVSNDTQNALDDKVDKVAGQGLSDENYTLSEKNKLAGIESGAEANTVDSVNTQTGDVVLDADDINDTTTTNKFTLQADIDRLANTSGTNTGDQDISGIGVNASDITDLQNDKVDKVAGKGLSDENYTLSEKNKLSGIESGAEVNTVDSVNTKTGDVVLDADDINDSTTANKFTSQADIDTLANTSGTNTGDQDISGIQTNASDITDLQNNKVDKVAGQGLSDENYTLTEKNKLAGIESGAEVNIPETITNLSITGNTLTYVNENGTNQDIDLSLYLDDTNLARIISGEYVASDNVLRFTRDDGSTFDIDASMFFDDTNIITSVNTQTGEVVLDADDINDTTTAHKFTSQADIDRLANTSGTNTGDQDISGIQTNASDITDLQNNKVDKVAGKGLSTEDYTTNEKNKLAGIESGAEVNTVDSVNTQTGDVVLDADDINDATTTNKFTSQADIDRLANTSGTNTGDQDLSDYVDKTTNQTIGGLKTFTQDVTIDSNIEVTNGNLLVGTTNVPVGANKAIVPSSLDGVGGGIIGRSIVNTDFKIQPDAGTFTIKFLESNLTGFLDFFIFGSFGSTNREGYALYRVIFNRTSSSVITTTLQAPTNTGGSFTTGLSFTASIENLNTLKIEISKPSGANYFVSVNGSFPRGFLSEINTTFL